MTVFRNHLFARVCLAIFTGLPAAGSTISFSSPDNTYYVGVEDAINSDYDYNDLIFSLVGDQPLTLMADFGSGFLQSSAPSLYSPYTAASNNPPPFWNRLSYDGTFSNFGECLYDSSSHNTCAGTALAPSAEYLAGSGPSQGSVDFFFSPTPNSTITVTLLAAISANGNLKSDLFYCPEGSTSGCQPINFGANSTATISPAGDFDLELVNGKLLFDSNTSVLEDSDDQIDHFAAAALLEAPEASTFALVGGALMLLGFRRGCGKHRAG